MNKNFALMLLEKTKQDYNRMAPVFSSKRLSITNDIAELAQYTKAGDRLLDLGCGNGRLVDLFRDVKIRYFGADISDQLLSLARSRYPKNEFRQVSFFHLPYPSNFFDKIYCLSVIHHIPSRELRLRFLKEVRRILRPGGLLVMTAWNLKRNPAVRLSIIKTNLLSFLKLTQYDKNDITFPFKDSKGNILANRYFHCFTLPELSSIVAALKFTVDEFGVLKRGKSGKNENLFVIAKK